MKNEGNNNFWKIINTWDNLKVRIILRVTIIIIIIIIIILLLLLLSLLLV